MSTKDLHKLTTYLKHLPQQSVSSKNNLDHLKNVFR